MCDIFLTIDFSLLKQLIVMQNGNVIVQQHQFNQISYLKVVSDAPGTAIIVSFSGNGHRFGHM
jgi:hypothetical protein